MNVWSPVINFSNQGQKIICAHPVCDDGRREKIMFNKMLFCINHMKIHFVENTQPPNIPLQLIATTGVTHRHSIKMY